jgi:hypothetical protein
MTIESLQSLVQAWSGVNESAQSYGISDGDLASQQETVHCIQECIDICTRIYSTLQGSDTVLSGN